VQGCRLRNRRQEISVLRRFAGCSRAKSRLRCGEWEAINIRVFRPSADFKRMFDARAAGFASNCGRICLDRLCHNAYKKRIQQEGAAGKPGGKFKSCGISWLLFS
jgi:hypothetical protein